MKLTEGVEDYLKKVLDLSSPANYNRNHLELILFPIGPFISVVIAELLW